MEMNNPEFTEIGILHLSDIHFSTEIDFITHKYKSFYNALKDDFQNCNLIFIVVSGDIANSGSASEYDKGLDFFRNLSENLNERYKSIKIRFIFVPGNHDCNLLRLDSKIRQNAVEKMSYETLGDDGSVLDTCIQIQAEFWSFFNKYNDIPENKAFYRISEETNGKKICFHCFNTAWMSKLKEEPGSLFFPVKKIPELCQTNDYDLNIAVFHHPTSWLTPNTAKNNRREFQDTLDIISSLQIIGHEHENELRQSENLDIPNSRTVCTTGEIFQKLNNTDVSGFQTFVINLHDNSITVNQNRYKWDTDLYQQYPQKEYSLEKRSKRVLDLQESFISTINKLNLPLTFENRKVTLSDLYVYPHLEHMNIKSTNKIDDYVDSSRLIDFEKEGTYVLEGESQIGKSSLLNILLLALYEKGRYPILLDGSKILTDNVEKLVKEAFKSQYADKDGNYDRYRQLPKQDKVLLIDDFSLCRLPREARNKLIESFGDIFGFLFLTIDAAYGMLPQCQSSFKNLNFYSIKPLGYEKRNLLVEKYIKYRHSNAIENDEFSERVKITFDKLSQILGNKLIPPYPVFVLTIIQALDYTPLDINETSYGYCYQTLIHLALNDKGVPKDHIDSYINFLTELAFEIFNKGLKSISVGEFESFYIHYHSKFWIPALHIVNEKLLNAQILKNECGEYIFSYVYIFYYLAAKKIAEIINKEEGQKIVRSLFEDLHIERNANILVFVTHHTKNEEFLEESILRAMTRFDGIAPITLKRNCNYYQLLRDIVKEIKNDVIEMRDPSQERNERLIEQDKHDLETTNKNSNIDEMLENNVHVRPFIHAVRSIEIVGQIVKNRKGSLETNTLKSMITELYKTAFRMINYLGELIKEGKDDLADKILEKIKAKDTNYDIERKVSGLLDFISLQACLGIFSKLIHHVGVKELHHLFTEVANDIDTPAAHLVSFSINTYYDKLNIKELERLAKDFEDNYVAMQILRSRIKAYIYNNHIDYKLKQQIGAYLQMNVPAKIGHKNQGI